MKRITSEIHNITKKNKGLVCIVYTLFMSYYYLSANIFFKYTADNLVIYCIFDTTILKIKESSIYAVQILIDTH